MQARDDFGDTLIGEIDGVNDTFKTSLPMRLDRPIQVRINGGQRNPLFSNGYDVLDQFTVRLLQAPLTGDDVQIMYTARPYTTGVPDSQLQGIEVLAEVPGAPLVEAGASVGPLEATVSPEALCLEVMLEDAWIVVVPLS